MTRDPFEVLDLRPGATPDEVHAAYIRLAKLVHPDRFALDPQDLKDEAARRMTELNLAYEMAMASFDAPAVSTGRRVCARCEPPSPDAASFQCARCKTWWDRTSCVRCGRPGYTVGGAGALFTCRDCVLAASPVTCGRCSAPASGLTEQGYTCAGCGTAWYERDCAYCGAPAFLATGNAAFRCGSCHFENAATTAP